MAKNTRKKILVFGGAGYIGSHTVNHLIKHDYDCVVADNLICGHKEAVPSCALFEKVDLLDPAGLRVLFENHHFDAVIHFAAFAYVGESVKEPQKYYIHVEDQGDLNEISA